MPGDARGGWEGRGAPATLALLALLWQGPQVTVVGRVSVVWWPPQGTLATALADQADRATGFPGIGPLSDRPLRLVLAPSRAVFDSVTRRRLPTWSDGAAFPEFGGVVLLSDRAPDRLTLNLRHELAHLALRGRVHHPLPLWFEEGYAAVAAAEWNRLDAFRLNWRLLRGSVLDLDAVDGALRGDASDAEGAYALATTAVLMLERWGGRQGLTPLLDHLATEPTFDAAIRATYHVTLDDFESRWARDVRRRYGWLVALGALGMFWGIAGVVFAWLLRRRRERDRARRAALDIGWEIPPDEPIA